MTERNEVVLVKSVRVLEQSEFQSSVYVQFEEDDGDLRSEFYLTNAAEFGNPKYLTVTIEPGDLLNTKESSLV